MGTFGWKAFSLVVALSAAGAASQPYLGDVTRWNDQDVLDPIQAGGVVFVGSSSIRRWEQLTRDFSDYRIIQRGFGGSQFEDLNFWVDELVLGYQPSAVVVWEGTNDLSTGETGAEVFADYQSFVATVQSQQPGVDIFYLGVTPTLANGPTTAERDAANASIAAAAAADPKLHYIDLPAAFYALNPPAAPEFTSLYVDPIHLNRAGYDLWTTIVRPSLEAVVAPNKAFVPNQDTLQPGGVLYFDFGPSNPQDGNQTIGPDSNGHVWNNWAPAEGNAPINAGEHIGGLVDRSGNNTGIGMVITGGFSSNGLVNGGLASPSPALLGDLAVPTATQDYFFSGADDLQGGGNDDIPGGFMLTGLDPAFVYEFTFFGTRTTADQIRETEYRVIGSTEGAARLVTTGPDIGNNGSYDGNDASLAVVSGIVPDAFGQVFVDLTVTRGLFAYLNAMRVEVVPLAVDEDPSDSVVSSGDSLSFTAGIVGSLPGVALRWERDGVPLADTGRVSGSATDTLTIADAIPADSGLFRLVAQAAGQTVETRPAIGGVRPASGDRTDFNGDGEIDDRDVIDFVRAIEENMEP
ncbi:MAG: GDSL-type esterase/lipase family protein [Planctomycetota bacterium]